MNTIYKYPLTAEYGTAYHSAFIPQGAVILKVGMQYGSITIWALVEAGIPSVQRKFAVFGTGHEIKEPEGLQYLNSVFANDFVWHVFEVKN